jgi:CheY-like chemotaxis protein
VPDKRICILLLEDSLLDAELIEARLARAEIDFAMDRVDTRGAYVSALETGRYDLILADYSLPSFDGLSALEIAREGWPDLPFVFVSGGLGEEVAIDSLKRGATDYLLKGKLDRLAPGRPAGDRRGARAGRPPAHRGGAARERGAATASSWRP